MDQVDYFLRVAADVVEIGLAVDEVEEFQLPAGFALFDIRVYSF
jgi:hypothetical protein